MSILNSINPFVSNNLATGYPYQAAQAQAPFQLDEDLEAQIQLRVNRFTERRAPVLRRQIFRVQGPAGRVQQVVRRLQTPPPDVIEKIIVEKPQRDVINLLIERPSTPPPTIQEKRIEARPHKPTITQQIVRVAPRTVQKVVQPIQPIFVQPVYSLYGTSPAYGSISAYEEPMQSGYIGY
jgi:hypothetical protein